MFKPQRLLARHPLDESSKLRLRALEPRDRARIEPRRAALLAAHGPLITIHTFRRRFAHRAVTLPGRGEQVEQIRSHAITSVSRWERDITRLSPPLIRTPSGITANNPDRSASERTNCHRNWAIYKLQTTCTRKDSRLHGRVRGSGIVASPISQITLKRLRRPVGDVLRTYKVVIDGNTVGGHPSW